MVVNDMNKPWYKSLTVVGALVLGICIILDYVLGNYAPAEIAEQVAEVTVLVKPAAGFTTVIGLRRAVGVKDEGAKPPTLPGGTK
jgi:hypothetical protein